MKNIVTAFILFVFTLSAHANEIPEKDWGIAIGIRDAKIPYQGKQERVNDIIPLLFYDGDIFFIRGLTGGARLYNKDKWQFSLIGRYRYFDVPAEEFQNLTRDNAFDIGGELKYRINNNFATSFEIMADADSRYYAALNTRYHWKSASWDLFPYITLRFKSADFNNHYFALDGFTYLDKPLGTIDNKIGSGFDLTLGSEIRYHIISNFYLIGRAQLTTLDSDTRSSPTISSGTYGEVFFGIGIFNDKIRKKSSALKAKPYLRVAHGWATPSDIANILVFDWDNDEQDNQLTSIFYGHPIADSLFGVEALDIYITLGYVYHHGSDPYSQTLAPGQGINTLEFAGIGNSSCDGVTDCTIFYDNQPTNEYVLGIKAYYNINWPVHWRLGVANGLSYIEKVSNIEQKEMDSKGYHSSNLMNYIDVTVDFSLGDVFGVKEMNDLYFGIGVHHRSSIFGTSATFGNISGGSNYNSIYLQYHF